MMETMKKNKIVLLTLAMSFLMGLSGCSDWLSLEPESEVLLENYWKTESDVTSAIAGCYRGMIEDDFVYRMIAWGELRSDNMTYGSSFYSGRKDLEYILDENITASNAYASWLSYYSVINSCNTLLYYAPLVMDRDKNFTQSDLQRAQAEALTIRALCYFYLVRTFKEVPYITDPSITDAQEYSIAKSSEDLVLDSIVSDLKTAQKYASTDYGSTIYNKGRVTLNAVNAILADVYLWREEYQNCIDCCNNVLSDASLELVEADYMYSRVFYIGNSTESIFELQFTDDVQENNPVYNLYGYSGDVLGEISFPTKLGYDEDDATVGTYSPFDYEVSTSAIESESDIRAKDFLNPELSSGAYFIFKYSGQTRTETTSGSTYTYRSSTPNWILYRLSDIYLMKAEALVELQGEDNMKGALSLVNKTYMRANEDADSLVYSNYNTVSQMEELVLRERQRELMFEGKRWFDLVRMARREGSTSTLNDYAAHKVSGNSTSSAAPVMNAMYMPISQDEIDANPNMVQNPYYEESSEVTR
jgi:starch-binding outer membrane protein, SusD/RagB family